MGRLPGRNDPAGSKGVFSAHAADAGTPGDDSFLHGEGVFRQRKQPGSPRGLPGRGRRVPQRERPCSLVDGDCGLWVVGGAVWFPLRCECPRTLGIFGSQPPTPNPQQPTSNPQQPTSNSQLEANPRGEQQVEVVQVPLDRRDKVHPVVPILEPHAGEQNPRSHGHFGGDVRGEEEAVRHALFALV